MLSPATSDAGTVPTEVPGVRLAPGQIQAGRAGVSFQVSPVLRDGRQIGALHTSWRDRKTQTLSQCGDAFVIGRDIEWISKRSTFEANGLALVDGRGAPQPSGDEEDLPAAERPRGG